MSRESFEITDYKLHEFAGGASVIQLYGLDGSRCEIRFVADDAPQVPVAVRNATRDFSFYYRENKIGRLIDMLRNEKPVYCIFKEVGGNNYSRISTELEPVGEEET